MNIFLSNQEPCSILENKRIFFIYFAIQPQNQIKIIRNGFLKLQWANQKLKKVFD
jgi:hypothetical protein